MKTPLITLLLSLSSLQIFAAWDGKTIATSYAGGDGSRNNPCGMLPGRCVK